MNRNTINDYAKKGALRRREAAAFIGASLPTLDELLHRAENPIPHIQIGRRIMIPVRDLQDWLSAEAQQRNSPDCMREYITSNKTPTQVKLGLARCVNSGNCTTCPYELDCDEMREKEGVCLGQPVMRDAFNLILYLEDRVKTLIAKYIESVNDGADIDATKGGA